MEYRLYTQHVKAIYTSLKHADPHRKSRDASGATFVRDNHGLIESVGATRFQVYTHVFEFVIGHSESDPWSRIIDSVHVITYEIRNAKARISCIRRLLRLLYVLIWQLLSPEAMCVCESDPGLVSRAVRRSNSTDPDRRRTVNIDSLYDRVISAGQVQNVAQCSHRADHDNDRTSGSLHAQHITR